MMISYGTNPDGNLLVLGFTRDEIRDGVAAGGIGFSLEMIPQFAGWQLQIIFEGSKEELARTIAPLLGPGAVATNWPENVPLIQDRVQEPSDEH